jgi:hypothetical protein
MASFRDSTGRPLQNLALLVHGMRGVDGKLPMAPQRLAVQRAIEFATLDQNALPSDPNSGHRSATSDNAEMVIWPVDVEGGRVTLFRGSIVSVMAGGHQVGHRGFTVPSPLEINLPASGVTLDDELVAVLYRLFMRRSLNDSEAARRRNIETAIGWLSQAWRNTPSIRPEDRIVMLKTGFEALFGESNTWKCAESMRKFYEASLAGVTELGARDLLWSPTETNRLTHTFKNKTIPITDLQHWFMAFGSARNAIIHDGASPKLTYRTKRSAYNGHMVFTAERLLRETIKVSLGHFGYPDIWRSQIWRAIARQMPKRLRSHPSP